MNSQKITGLADGTASNDAVNKGQLDAAISGLHWKESVKAATTESGTLASDYANGDSIDGVSLSTGDRILIKNQTGANQKQNGIYVVKASGAPDRASDMNEADEFSGSAVFVQQGSVNADTAWVCSNDGPVVVDTTNITFSQFSGGGSLTAGSGITISGNTISIGTGAISDAMLAGSISNGKLSNSTVSFGGVSLALGASDATPAFDLTDATNYPTSSLTGTITNAQLAGGIDQAKLAGSIWIDKLSISIQREAPTTNGSTTSFNLGVASTPDNSDTVAVFLNGMMCERKGTLTTPGIATEYKVSRSGTTTVVEMGAAPAASDFLYVEYWT